MMAYLCSAVPLITVLYSYITSNKFTVFYLFFFVNVCSSSFFGASEILCFVIFGLSWVIGLSWVTLTIFYVTFSS